MQGQNHHLQYVFAVCCESSHIAQNLEIRPENLVFIAAFASGQNTLAAFV